MGSVTENCVIFNLGVYLHFSTIATLRGICYLYTSLNLIHNFIWGNFL